MQYNANTNIFTLTIRDARKIERYTPAAYDRLPNGRKLNLDVYKDGKLLSTGPFSTSSFSFLKGQRWTIAPEQGLISQWYEDFDSISASRIIQILSEFEIRRRFTSIQLTLV